MGFMDKLKEKGIMDKAKDVGKNMLKTVLLAANDWPGKVLDGMHDGFDLKGCLVATDSEGKALVFFKGVNEVHRIPVSEIGTFRIEPNIDSVSAITAFDYQDDKSQIVTIMTCFNKGDSNSGKIIPGVYYDTKLDSYKKFISFLRMYKIPVEGTKENLKIIEELVSEINKIYKG